MLSFISLSSVLVLQNCARAVATVAVVNSDLDRASAERAAGKPKKAVAVVQDDLLCEDSNVEILRRTNAGKMPNGEQVVYDHMPKTGGTFISFVLKESLGRADYRLIREFDGITKLDEETKFMIGSVRNPCDYYVSLWAYGVEYKGSMYGSVPNNTYLYDAKSPSKDSTADVLRFRQWLRAISMRENPGTFSVRIATSYSGNQHLGRNNRPVSSLDKSTVSLVKQALDDFNPENIDCWIREENLEATLKTCLKRWESNTKKQVLWDRFANSFTSDGQADFEATHFGKTGNHGKCERYFDKESSSLIREIDGDVAPLGRVELCVIDYVQQRKALRGSRPPPS